MTSSTMLYKSTDVKMKAYKENEEFQLHFKFMGVFTKETCQSVCEIWKQELNKKDSKTKYNLIWDCTALKGIETSANKEWIRTIRLFKNSIRSVTIISDSILVRSLGHLMSQSFSFKLNVLRLHEYLEMTLEKE